MNVLLVSSPLQAHIFGLQGWLLSPYFLDTLCEPEAPNLPPLQGSQGSWFWCYTPSTTKETQPPSPQLPWKSRLSLLFLLEGNVAAWIHLSQFKQLHPRDATWRRFLVLFFKYLEKKWESDENQAVTNPWFCGPSCSAVISRSNVVKSAQRTDVPHYYHRPRPCHPANQVMLITGFEALQRQIGVNDLLESQRRHRESVFLWVWLKQGLSEKNKTSWRLQERRRGE